MTQTAKSTFYVDSTMLRSFLSCRKHYELRHMRHLAPIVVSAPLSFGKAWHVTGEMLAKGIPAEEVTTHYKTIYTNETKDETGRKLLMIYIPTAPIPTSGYFEIVTEDKVARSNITVDEAMQMVISSGMVVPDMIDTKETSDLKHEEKS